jgi:hypothetical protein
MPQSPVMIPPVATGPAVNAPVQRRPAPTVDPDL